MGKLSVTLKQLRPLFVAQLKGPIVRSPLLMNCYMKHITQAKCSYWTNIPDKPYQRLPRVRSPLTPMVELASTLNSEHDR